MNQVYSLPVAQLCTGVYKAMGSIPVSEIFSLHILFCVMPNNFIYFKYIFTIFVLIKYKDVSTNPRSQF